MNKSHVAALLALCAAYDRRTVGDSDVEAWAALFGEVDFEDARDAVVAYYGRNREWIMPSDVLDRVREVWADRLARNPIRPEEHKCDPHDGDAFARERRELYRLHRSRPAELRAIQ